MLGTLRYFLAAAAALMLMQGVAIAGPDTAMVTFKDGSKQVLVLNRDASLIRRVMFDSEKPKDRLVVTYRDDTHQVFKLNQKIASIKKMVFEGGDMVELPPVPKTAQQSSVSAMPSSGEFMPRGIKLGRVWQVTERCGGVTWRGVWTRRGESNVFDAEWVSNLRDSASGIVEFREVSKGRLILHRSDNGTTYTGTMSRDGKRVINGWASWYSPTCEPWYAVID